MDTILDHLTLERASTHNFKDYELSRGCFEKYGPWAFRWAMGRPSTIKIVRLAAIWKFFRGGHEKFQKTAFFAKNPSPRYFLMGKFFQDRTMSKLSSRGFRKCGTFWAYDLFNGSYCCSKSAQGSKSVFVLKNKRCQKKDTATILSFLTRHWISAWETHFFRPWFNAGSENSKLWPCLFFLHGFWMSKKIEILLNFDSQ